MTAVNACEACQDAIDLDQVALMKLDERITGDVGIAVIACDEHLRHVALALEVLDRLETIRQIAILPPDEVAFADRILARPERRS